MSTHKIPASFKKNHFEKLAEAENRLICGSDEVGRACLAGPVVVAALALKPKALRKGKMPRIADSKQMTLEERETAYTWLIKNSWHTTASISHRGIDSGSIHTATLDAMKRAIIQLHLTCPEPISATLIDAMPVKIPNLYQKQSLSQNLEALAASEPETLLTSPWGHIICFNYGEDRSITIAGASIVAKVTRDQLMGQLEKLFPAYNFGSHKGYPTQLHGENLQKAGASIIHRLSFMTKKFSPQALETQVNLSLLEQTPPF